jgi:hypothetical protein
VENHGKMLKKAPDFCGVHHEKWGEKWRKMDIPKSDELR